MKKTIHYAFILDQSGSMIDLKTVVISCFNEQVELINKLRRENPETRLKITYCLFNDTVSFRYLGEDSCKLEKLSEQDYCPDSCTALYDAIGMTMLHLRELKKSHHEVFLAIFTDGLENASRKFNLAEVRSQLQQAEKENWIIRFYCNYTDLQYFKCQLDLPDSNLSGVCLNESGLKVMETDIEFHLDKIISNSNPYDPSINQRAN